MKRKTTMPVEDMSIPLRDYKEHHQSNLNKKLLQLQKSLWRALQPETTNCTCTNPCRLLFIVKKVGLPFNPTDHKRALVALLKSTLALLFHQQWKDVSRGRQKIIPNLARKTLHQNGQKSSLSPHPLTNLVTWDLSELYFSCLRSYKQVTRSRN